MAISQSSTAATRAVPPRRPTTTLSSLASPCTTAGSVSSGRCAAQPVADGVVVGQLARCAAGRGHSVLDALALAGPPPQLPREIAGRASQAGSDERLDRDAGASRRTRARGRGPASCRRGLVEPGREPCRGRRRRRRAPSGRTARRAPPRPRTRRAGAGRGPGGRRATSRSRTAYSRTTSCAVGSSGPAGGRRRTSRWSPTSTSYVRLLWPSPSRLTDTGPVQAEPVPPSQSPSRPGSTSVDVGEGHAGDPRERRRRQDGAMDFAPSPRATEMLAVLTDFHGRPGVPGRAGVRRAAPGAGATPAGAMTCRRSSRT